MKPLISYYGGKQRLAPYIVPILQKIPHTVRCIPFAGGLGIFYAWPKSYITNNDHYREIINDNSELLINLYRVARENPQEFDRIIQYTPYSQSEHQRAIHICKNPDGFDDLQKAWAYYTNIQQSFANVLNAGWGVTVMGHNRAATWDNARQRIPACLERLKDVHIACEDALRCIERWDSPQTLFYCDPPYPEANQGHYEGYSLEDWAALCDCLDSIEGSYVLSNYPQSVEPKSAQQRVEIVARMSSSAQGTVGKGRDKTRAATQDELGDRTRTEVLWVCDRSGRIRSDLQHATIARAAPPPQLSIFDIA
jgi:DNA adenine methylase